MRNNEHHFQSMIRPITLFASQLNPFKGSRIIWLLGFLGWALLLWRLIPGNPTETLKEALRERDDRLHGELWDLHYCMGDTGFSAAEISYPEPTQILRYDTSKIQITRKGVAHPESTTIRRWINEEAKKQHEGDPSWKPEIVSIYDTLTTDTTVLKIEPRFKYSLGRGTILHDNSKGPYHPPGNTRGSNSSGTYCTGVIGIRGHLPDSLRVQVVQDRDTLPEHWVTGIKSLASKKRKITNRTRITIVFYSPDRYDLLVSERPRQDMYSCSYNMFSPVDCAEEGWLDLLWKGVVP